MSTDTHLTQQRLKTLLRYDRTTGLFTWRLTRGGVKEGAPAGQIGTTHGYIRIVINRRPYQAHRLAWLYEHGEWPGGPIDHIDRDRQNNRLSNLRVATWRQNQQNKLVRRDSHSGMKGIYRTRQNSKWYARIRIDGRRVRLGVFETPEMAAAAYEAAAAKHFGDFAPTAAKAKG